MVKITKNFKIYKTICDDCTTKIIIEPSDDDTIKVKVSVTTIDSVPVTRFVYTPGKTGIYYVEVRASALNTSNDAYLSKVIRAFKLIGGTLTELTGDETLFFNDAGMEVLTVDPCVSGSDICVEVTGIDAMTIDWNLSISIEFL